MDAVFLNALIANPDRAPDFFLRLARLQPSAAFARFMSDQATAADVLRVVTALPPGPFLRALRSSPAVVGRAA
jgi:lycopene beta-cyclase